MGSSTSTINGLLVTVLLAGLTIAHTSTPSPVSVTFGTDFVGYDGQWSPAQIRVGTNPEQWLLLLPTTLSSETWVVGPGGCDSTQTCRSKRGGVFYANQSSTWNALGYFELGYNTLSQTNSVGQYGFDNIGISDTVSVSSQTVAIVNSTDVWDGHFGLGVQETRYNDNVDHLSFLSTLVQNASLVPSHSYGYTAGASYAQKSIVGSLTLGGVDTTRYQPNNSTFTLGSTYEPVLTVSSIQVTSGSTIVPPDWSANPLSLMTTTSRFTAIIDTSTPFLWMPRSVCDAFASALNLTYDQTLQLYTFPANSSPTALSQWDLSFAFTFADSASSTTTYTIPITYDAFNSQLSYPFPGLNATYTSSPVNYFPMRRANSSSQYTIGRMFLQESYLAVDYERATFSLMPAAFPNLNVILPNIVAIPRPANSTWPGPTTTTSKHSPSTGAKAGIGIGTGIAAMLVLAGALIRTRKRHSVDKDNEKGTPTRRKRLSLFRKKIEPQSGVSELMADKQHPRELNADISNTRYEIDGDVPAEMPAAEVSSEFYQARLGTRASAVARNNPARPAELEHPVDIAKGSMLARVIERQRAESPVPPYSPSDNHTNSFSPTTLQHGHSFGGSQSSGEMGISPISPVLHGTSDSNNTALMARAPSSEGNVSQDGATNCSSSTRDNLLAPPQTSGSVTRQSVQSSANDQSNDSHRDAEQALPEQPLRRRFSWEE